MPRSYFAVCDSVDGSGMVVIECRDPSERFAVLAAEPAAKAIRARRARSADFRNDYHQSASEFLRSYLKEN